jgi:hypothetical protein
VNTSENIDLIAPKWVAALSKMRSIVAGETANVPTKTGGSYSYNYAGLPSVTNTIREILIDNELAFSQSVIEMGARVGVITRIWHTSGQWIDHGPLPMPVGGGGAQDVGSAITYGRRYALLATCGIATVDDDDDGKRAQDASKAPHPNSERVADVRTRLTKLPADGKYLFKHWRGTRSVEAGALLADGDWLTHVETTVGEIEDMEPAARKERVEDIKSAAAAEPADAIVG